MKYRSMKGFSGIELLIVIAVIAILAAGAYVANQTLFEGADASALTQEIGYVDSAVTRVYGGSNSYEGLDNDAIETSVPSSMVTGDGNLVHAFGDSITVTSTGDNDEQYQITVDDIPDAACTEVASTFLNVYDEVAIDGAAVTNPGEAAAACGGNVALTSR